MPPWGPGKLLWVDPSRISAPSPRGSWNSRPAINPKTWDPSYTTVPPYSLTEFEISLTG